MSSDKLFPILFVGAGPGDPDLITVAGRDALEHASLVVYAGSLVSDEMLNWTSTDSENVDSSGLDLDQIIDCMSDAYFKGKRVVRLHTGDPSIYGAVNEQFRALEKQGIPYQVIPGVTSALAGAAALGLEFTLPEICQTLIITRVAGRTLVPAGEELSALAAHGVSLAIYLSSGQAKTVSAGLIEAFGPEAPLAVVYRASWPDEKILWTCVEKLPEDMDNAGIARQALILAGPAVAALKNNRDTPASKLYDTGFSHGYRKANMEEPEAE